MAHDRYKDFMELSVHEQEGTDYRIRLVGRASAIAVLAPHGGLIEPGSCTIAEAIAGTTCSFYSFSGCRTSGNYNLHLTSTRFDEPLALGLLKTAQTVLTVHGCRGLVPQIHVGGRDHRRVAAMISALKASGFAAEPAEYGLAGCHPGNLCNRGTSGMGIQLEISAALRYQLCVSTTALTPRSALDDGKGSCLPRFVRAVRTALELPPEPVAAIS